jgi:hypothetical protein
MAAKKKTKNISTKPQAHPWVRACAFWVLLTISRFLPKLAPIQSVNFSMDRDQDPAKRAAAGATETKTLKDTSEKFEVQLGYRQYQIYDDLLIHRVDCKYRHVYHYFTCFLFCFYHWFGYILDF